MSSLPQTKFSLDSLATVTRGYCISWQFEHFSTLIQDSSQFHFNQMQPNFAQNRPKFVKSCRQPSWVLTRMDLWVDKNVLQRVGGQEIFVLSDEGFYFKQGWPVKNFSTKTWWSPCISTVSPLTTPPAPIFLLSSCNKMPGSPVTLLTTVTFFPLARFSYEIGIFPFFVRLTANPIVSFVFSSSFEVDLVPTKSSWSAEEAPSLTTEVCEAKEPLRKLASVNSGGLLSLSDSFGTLLLRFGILNEQILAFLSQNPVKILTITTLNYFRVS